MASRGSAPLAARGGPAAARSLQSSGSVDGSKKAIVPLDLSEVHELELPSMIEDLAKQQAEFEEQGNFKEAEEIRRTLENFQEAEAERRREEMRSQMIAERLGVEEAHMQELKEFHESWDQKDAEYEKHVSDLQQSLQRRHEEAHKQYVEKIWKETDATPKWSKELLNLRKIIETLGKQKNYIEAGKVKDEADKIEKKEMAVWTSKRESKLAVLQEQFLHKQQMEMGGLIERIDTNRKEHKQSRKKELERILQRYDNVKKQMERQQKITTRKIEQYHLDRGSEWDTMSISAASSRPSMLGTQGASRLGSRLGIGSGPGARAPSEISDPSSALSEAALSKRQPVADELLGSARQLGSGPPTPTPAKRQPVSSDGATGLRQSLGTVTAAKKQSVGTDERPVPGRESRSGTAGQSAPARSNSATGLRVSGSSGGYPGNTNRGGSLTAPLGGGAKRSLTPPLQGPRSGGSRTAPAVSPSSPQPKKASVKAGPAPKMRNSQSGGILEVGKGAWR